jgi:adenosine deaminase
MGGAGVGGNPARAPVVTAVVRRRTGAAASTHRFSADIQATNREAGMGRDLITIRVAMLVLAHALLLGGALQAQTFSGPAEEQTSRYFDAIRGDPARLLMFLREMPKGGDLHSHLSGAVYAESYIAWAADDGLCIDTAVYAFAPPPCDVDAGRPPAAAALRSSALYDRMIDALSVRNWNESQRSGHAQFFGTFDRFRLISIRTGDMLAEVASRAALGHVSYLELMLTPDGIAVANLGSRAGWTADLDALRERLLQAGLRDTLHRARRSLDGAEAAARQAMACGTAQADGGCDVVIRYQYQVARARPPESVFAQLLAAFELTTDDPRIVAINMVQPEDHLVAMRDFELHMDMIGYLRTRYPGVRLTLHAGELRSGLVPPEGLRFHIRSSIERGHASRIGHGVSIAHERDADGLLRDMARRGILVEIALSSNDVILGVRGAEHPLRLYLDYGVPVALVTDDEGVLRSELTMEFLKAVREHQLGYPALKQMARNSLEYSFLEGASLWSDLRTAQLVPACAAAAGLEAAACRQHIDGSVKARLQAELEADFAVLEQKYGMESAWTAR